VLKCTHDSGSVIICNDKNTFNISSARIKLESALKQNYFWTGRESPYKKIKPRIICEKLMKDERYDDLVDYKFLCFDGQPKLLFYASERFTSKDRVPKNDFYDMDLNNLPIKSEGHENSGKRPNISSETFEKMKELAQVLADGFPLLRVDFYEINNRIYFGELTFHHNSGLIELQPDEWNITLGQWIHLPDGTIKY
jgi:hypothetical protein